MSSSHSGLQPLGAIVVCLLLANRSTGNFAEEDSLIATLQNGYSKNARPPPSDQPTAVHVGMFLQSIDEVDEHRQTLSVSAIIEVTWNDSRLSWNSSQWLGIDAIAMSSSSIWKPDCALTDPVDDVYNDIHFSDFYSIALRSSGKALWSRFGSINVRCDYYLAYYPFDVQTCDFRFESFNYPLRLLQMYTELQTINMDLYHESGEFEILSTRADTDTIHYEGEGNYSGVIFSVTMKRRPLYFILNLVAPCILLTILTCFAFLLPLSSGERVGMTVTLFLSFTVFQLLLTGNLPPSSMVTPLLTIYISTAMILTGISLVATIFVMRLAGSDGDVPQWVEQTIINKLGVVVGVTKRSPKVEATNCASRPHSAAATSEDNDVRSDPKVKSLQETRRQQDPDMSAILEAVQCIERLLSDAQPSPSSKKWTTVSEIVDRVLFYIYCTAVTLLGVICLAVFPSQSVAS